MADDDAVLGDGVEHTTLQTLAVGLTGEPAGITKAVGDVLDRQWRRCRIFEIEVGTAAKDDGRSSDAF